jgi:subtilisin-like proprotein convertase family protein/subtilisin family serine protease
MSEGQVCRVIAAMVVACGAAGGSLAMDGQPRAPEGMEVRTTRGIERFLIDSSNSRLSEARRINEDMRTKDGKIPEPTPGYVISHRVIVSPPPESVLFPHPFMTLKSAPNHAIVLTESIEQAIALANELSQRREFEHVYLDTRAPTTDRFPTDPNFAQQWHLLNSIQPGIDTRVGPVWMNGHTGYSTVIGIIEAGFQVTHPDLAPNYNAQLSMPGGISSGHATAVAGIAAAASGNGIGGVGVAYNAQLTKLVYGVASDTANAFGWHNDVHTVKNNSWGPLDNGIIATITPIEQDALASTVHGRNGFGTIIVWAGGNGAAAGDRVDYDPYASSRYSIAVGAINDTDKKSVYSEPGASLLVVAHSSGGPTPGHRSIFTTTAGSGFTSTFGGTSAAAPIVTGVVALLLDAIPYLSWRDVQQILVRSARLCDPSSPTWELNGAGLDVSYDYGFGAVDAQGALALAKRWHPMAPERLWTSSVVPVGAEIPDNKPGGVSRTLHVDQDLVVEAVEVKLNVLTEYVGDLKITLTAPSGKQSILALSRADSTDNYINQVFTTKRHWDERAGGTWRVRIEDLREGDIATWQDLTLNVYGHCPSDVNRDGIVDVLDLLDFIESYNGCDGQRAPCFGTPEAAADYNRDGAIDVLDLLDLLNDLGAGC